MAKTVERRSSKEQAPLASAEEAVRPWWRTWSVGVAIFLFALAVRGVFLAQIHDARWFVDLTGDDAAYDAWAQTIAAGNWIGDTVFYQAPLYPYFLAVVYSVLGRDFLALRVVQILIGSGACVLAWRAGRHFFGPRAGIVAGVMLAVYPTAIFFDYQVDKSVLDLFLMAALLSLVGGMLHRASLGRSAAIGALLGLFALSRENALVFAPLLGAWLLLGFRGDALKARLSRAGLFAAGLAAVLLPVAMRNAAVGGSFQPTTAQAGPNFWMGNNAQADGLYMPVKPDRANAKFERIDATELAEEALGRKLTAGEVSSWWLRRAMADIAAHPARWVELMGRKWLLVWDSLEIPDNGCQYRDSVWSPLMGFLTTVFHFGVLVPLAVLGVVLTWGDRRRLWILYAMVLVYAVAVVLFFVGSRYRYPLVPPLVLFAAAAAVGGVEHLNRAQWRRLAIGGAVAVAVAVVVNAHLAAPPRLMALVNYNPGKVYEWKGQPEPAMAFYADAIAHDPNFYMARIDLGRLLEARGDLAGAIAHYVEALKARPRHFNILTTLGVALAKAGQPDLARAQFERAIEYHPAHGDAYANMGLFLLKEKKPAEALPYLQKAVDLQPAHPPFRFQLATALGELGNDRAAVGELAEALRLDPRAPAIVQALRRIAVSSADPAAREAAVTALSR